MNRVTSTTSDRLERDRDNTDRATLDVLPLPAHAAGYRWDVRKGTYGTHAFLSWPGTRSRYCLAEVQRTASGGWSATIYDAGGARIRRADAGTLPEAWSAANR